MSTISEIVFLVQTGRIELAQRKLKELISQNINNEELYYLLAYTYYLDKDNDQAITIVKQALKINPNYVEAILLLAKTQIALNNFYRAKSLIDQAIKLNPENEDAFSLKASIAIEEGDLKNAEKLIDKSLEINPTDIESINFKVNILIIKNKLKEAGILVKKALEINPIHELNFFNKGLISFSEGKLQEAKAHFFESLRINPNNEPALFGLKSTIQSKNPIFWISTKLEFFIARHQKIFRFLIKALWKIVIFIGLLIYAVTDEIDYLVVPSLGFFSIILFISRTPSLISTILLRFDEIGKQLVSNTELLLKLATILLIIISPIIIYYNPSIYENQMKLFAFIIIIVLISVMMQDVSDFKTNAKKILGLLYIMIIGISGFFYLNTEENWVKEFMGYILMISTVVYPLIFEFMNVDEQVQNA